MRSLNVLIGCESSGVIREAFRKRGHYAMSVDLLPTVRPGARVVGDIRNVLALGMPWDLFICHPDCTYLTSSAAWAFKDGPYHQKVKPGTLVGAERRVAREQALDFVREMMAAPVEHIAIENPVGAISTNVQPATQYIQPYEFGEDASKKTGLWLKNLPPLRPTKRIHGRVVNGRERWANQTDSGQNALSPSADRWRVRSVTYQGWADAMADQWGKFIVDKSVNRA